MYESQSSRLVPLHYRHGFHSRLADLNRLLRYFLGMLLLVFSARGTKKWRGHFCHTLHVAMQIRLYLLPEPQIEIRGRAASRVVVEGN